MLSIFISYRRSDSGHSIGRIYDRLISVFGKEQVFEDIHSMPLGVDFREYLVNAVQQCSLQLVVIGPNWLSATDQLGGRRLDNPNDWVRIEVESALHRDIPVIPLLVDGATMPLPTELPESLQNLAYRNWARIRPDPDFHHDMDRLIRGILNSSGKKTN